MKKSSIFKVTATLINILVCGASGLQIYYMVKHKTIYAPSSEEDFKNAIILLLLPCVVCVVLSLIYGHSNTWKAALGVCVACPIFNIMIMDSGITKIFPIKGDILDILQVAIPLVCLFFGSMNAIFREPEVSYEYTASTYSSSSTHNYDDTGAYGFPAGHNSTYLPDDLKGPY
ncbi:MAG: hypothetical protein J6A78_00525 [Clostridia bacterium]|nr:hypothetical protein [Clostridia bacterium]